MSATNDYTNSIPFRFDLEPGYTGFAVLHSDLREQLKGLEDFKVWKKIHDSHLLLILQNLYLAHQVGPETYVAYSRRSNAYSTPKARSGAFKVSYKATVRIVDGLYDLGYLEGTKGIYYDQITPRNKTLIAFVARMRATAALTKLLPGLTETSLKLTAKERDLIRLNDPEDRAMDFPETEQTQRMRDNLRQINAVNQNHFVALCVLDEEFRNLYKRLNKGRNSGQTTSDMYFGRTDVYRTFCNGTFEEGGRFYGPWWQNLPREYRKFIRIDNFVVSELDYSCLHPTLLYLEEGIPAPDEDMYEVPGFPPEARPFLKKVMNIILNAKGQTSAEKAIRSEQRKDPDYPPLPEGMTLRSVLQGFMEKHAKISHHFYTAAGRRLQKVDADIAEAVMLNLAKIGIPSLVLHDSFLVSRLHRDDLEQTMNQVVSARYNAAIKIKADETAWDFLREIGVEDDYDGRIEVYEHEAIDHPSFTIYNQQYQAHRENQVPSNANTATPGTQAQRRARSMTDTLSLPS